jgi:rhomboid protease GluP
MSAPPTHSPDLPDGDSSGELAAASRIAGVYPTGHEAWQHALVVLAMGLPCWILATPQGHELRVDARADLPRIRDQLDCFDRESVGWPPPRIHTLETHSPRASAPLSPALWVIALFAVFHLQLKHPALTDAALLDAERVFGHGEWWRAASALWLHGDFGHLLSNAGSGALVFTALVHTFREPLRAWTLLAAAAILGNLAAVAIHHGEPYRSLGASTAVFAGLGLLTGRAARLLLQGGGARRWRAVALPLLSGLVVLGLLGAGEARVDVVAHATGFIAGVLVALLAAPKPRRA